VSAERVPAADELAIQADLDGATFVLGVCDKRWRLAAPIDWPYLYIAVSAAERRKAPNEYVFRFNCAGYPKGVTGSLWDLSRKTLPEITAWPAGRIRVPSVFRPDWKSGTALYLPCDCVSIQGHEAWHSKHPSQCWSEKIGIVRYLEVLSELLNSSDYSGLRSA
jgi:hypothetical protein